MKLWFGYSSEHSSNLVMIGHFKEVADTRKAKEIIDMITKQVMADERAGLLNIGEIADRYTKDMLDLLGKLNVSTISPAEIEQFAYDVTTKIKDNQVVITTEEIDVSAFLKVLVHQGARVEVFSAHNYPDTPHGRGK